MYKLYISKEKTFNNKKITPDLVLRKKKHVYIYLNEKFYSTGFGRSNMLFNKIMKHARIKKTCDRLNISVKAVEIESVTRFKILDA